MMRYCHVHHWAWCWRYNWSQAFLGGKYVSNYQLFDVSMKMLFGRRHFIRVEFNRLSKPSPPLTWPFSDCAPCQLDDLDKLGEIQRGQTNCFATHNLDLDGLPVCLLIRFVIGICLVLFVKSDVEKQIDTIWISVLLVNIYFSPYCWWSSDKQELFI